jgi:Spy/CpxP family protein refolding chaperone
MTRKWKIILGAGALALAATAASTAYAQVTAGDQATPKSFNWEIKDGKRVPKGNKQVNADGSWREEIRQGKCVTIKEKSAAGEYKETRKCDE